MTQVFSFVIKILLFANIIMYLQLQSFNRLFLKHRETLIHGTLKDACYMHV